MIATLLLLLAADPKTTLDVPYAGTKNKKQTLDIYAPAEGKGHPVFVWIHGGGWQGGDKKEANAKPRAFAEKGYVFVSVNYRLLPEAKIGEMAGDVAKAIGWVHANIKKHGGDPGVMFVSGHSAGAQLAALVCTDGKYLKAEGLALSAILGCIPVDGDTYDVPMQVATVEDRRADVYRKKFGDEASQKALSPVTHVEKGKGIPPFLILHVADHPETRGQSRRLVNALKYAGIEAEAWGAADRNHVSLDVKLGEPGDRPSEAMFGFLNRLLKKR
jgi:acetyl esterase/lipase